MKKIKKMRKKAKRDIAKRMWRVKKLRKFIVAKFIMKCIGKLLMFCAVFFVGTFAIYMFNGENKLIYYVVRPLLNKHYDSQVRDRKI